MTILVLAEHNNIDIKSSTLNTISAASQIDQDIHVLVTGHECEELAKNISKCEKVSKVYLANGDLLIVCNILKHFMNYKIYLMTTN